MMNEIEFRNSIPIVFNEYLDEDENRFCVDCKQPNPDWCSLGFGTLICLDCAGQHRSLGVHLTLVKSLTLDQWTETQYKFLKHGGNLRFLSYLEDIRDQNGEKCRFPTTIDKYKNRQVIYYREILLASVEERSLKPIDDEDLIRLFEKVQQGSAKSSPLSPKWVSDSNSIACMICHSTFTIFKRRHHCRRCGQIVCKECAPSKNTRPIPEYGLMEPVRHCKNCFKSPALDWN